MSTFNLDMLYGFEGERAWILFEDGSINFPICLIDDINMGRLVEDYEHHMLETETPVDDDSVLFSEHHFLLDFQNKVKELRKISESKGHSVLASKLDFIEKWLETYEREMFDE